MRFGSDCNRMRIKTFEFTRGLVQEYRSSLKPKETEEVINQFFNRPLAFLAAKFFKMLNLTPNSVTMISMAFGVSSGIFFARGKNPWVLIGAILLQGMIIFDCADGQLARMLKKSSQFGKTIDGLADIATHFSIFYGIAYALFMKTGSIYQFFLALAAQLSMYLHIMLYDHFKNVFISVAKPDYSDKLETLYKLKKEKRKEERGLKRIMNVLYYIFYQIEASVVSIGYLPLANSFYDIFPDPERIDQNMKVLYYREMRASVKIWSFIGDTSHLTLFVVCGILNRISYIFPITVICTNLYMIFAFVYQKVKFKRFGLNREIVWQERID